MKRVFAALFVVTLVLVLCCPAFGSTNDEVRGTNGNSGGLCPPEMNADSGLTWYQVAGVLALLGGGGALGWTGCKKMQAIRVEPQPLEVKLSKDYVTRSEFEDYRKQVGDDIASVHKRLDTVTPAVAQMQGKLDMIAANQDKILNLLMTGRAAGAGNPNNRQS